MSRNLLGIMGRSFDFRHWERAQDTVGHHDEAVILRNDSVNLGEQPSEGCKDAQEGRQ